MSDARRVSTAPHRRHLLLTVGTGTSGRYSNLAQGLVHTIGMADPDHFWLVPSASEDSMAVAALIEESLPQILQSRLRQPEDGRTLHLVSNHDSLEEARAVVGGLIRMIRQDFPDAHITVNPTSGTKQMSAGATLAALDEAVDAISFTTGERRDGVVVTGTENITPFDPSRWRAEKEAVLAADLWNRNLHAAAAQVLRMAARHLATGDSFRERLLGLAMVADALALQEGFLFQQAALRFRNARKDLKPDRCPDGSPLRLLGDLCNDSRRRMERLAQAQGGGKSAPMQRELLAELIDNALRASNAGRHEDASCRLYRAIEMELQIRLAEHTGNRYWNGRLASGTKPPVELTDAAFLTAIRRPELPREFSMEQLARALNALGDPSMRPLCEDLDADYKSRFRAATEKRNASILAHGVTPVDARGFTSLRNAAEEFAGMRIRETHPLPAFDTGWLAPS